VGAAGGCCLCDVDCAVGVYAGTIKFGEADREVEAGRGNAEVGREAEAEEAGRGGEIAHGNVF
jgi:hypothetical protein